MYIEPQSSLIDLLNNNAIASLIRSYENCALSLASSIRKRKTYPEMLVLDIIIKMPVNAKFPRINYNANFLKMNQSFAKVINTRMRCWCRACYVLIIQEVIIISSWIHFPMYINKLWMIIFLLNVMILFSAWNLWCFYYCMLVFSIGCVILWDTK